MKKEYKKRGQVFMVDLLLALAIFFAMIFVYLYAWDLIDLRLQSQNELDELKLKAISISDILIMTPGLPEGWTTSNVAVIGLGSGSPREISQHKTALFSGMDYDTAKKHLTLGTEDFRFRIYSLNGSVLEDYGSAEDNEIAFAVIRYAYYNNETVKAELRLSR